MRGLKLKVCLLLLLKGDARTFESENGTDLSNEEETIWGEFIDKDGINVKVSGMQTYDARNHIMYWITFRDWGYKKTASRIACRFTDNDTLKSLLTSHIYLNV
ncbi:hypothetical protein ACFSTH_00930 [Paenibacillus yanchengensis]